MLEEGKCPHAPSSSLAAAALVGLRRGLCFTYFVARATWGRCVGPRSRLAYSILRLLQASLEKDLSYFVFRIKSLKEYGTAFFYIFICAIMAVTCVLLEFILPAPSVVLLPSFDSLSSRSQNPSTFNKHNNDNRRYLNHGVDSFLHRNSGGFCCGWRESHVSEIR
jgi:hypothetical protein